MSKAKKKRPWKQPGTRMVRIRETSRANLWRIADNDNRPFITTVEEIVAEALERRGMAQDP